MDTKEKITQTAFVIFLENGYKGTTYSELIETMGISKGALYYHFDNKEELFFEVIDKYFLTYFNKVDWSELENMEPEKLEKRVQDYYHGFVTQIRELTDKGMSRYFILFFEALELYPRFKEETQKFYTRFKQVVEETINKSGAKGNAVELISKYEGYLFWLAIFPDEAFDSELNFRM